MIISVSLCNYCEKRLSPKDETRREKYWTIINVYVWFIQIISMCEIYVKKLFFVIYMLVKYKRRHFRAALKAMQEWSSKDGASNCDTSFFFCIIFWFIFFWWGEGSMYVSAIDLKHFKNVHREATVMFTIHVIYCYE